MNDINKLKITELIKIIPTLSNEELKSIMYSKDFLSFDNNKINCFFLNVPNEIKDEFISNDILLSKLLKSILIQKSKFNAINEEYQFKIIQHVNSFLVLNDVEFYNLIKSMKIDIFEKFTDNLNRFIYYTDNIKTNNKLLYYINKLYNEIKYNNFDGYYVNKFKEYLKNKIKIKDSTLFNEILKKILNRNRNIFELYNITMEKQMYIFNKFNIVVDESLFNEENDEEFNISFELLEKLNTKHIIKIIEKLKSREKNIDNTKVFITSIKLYTLFGFDNTLKILNDKFTYTTEASITRAANFNFDYKRRIYRLNHQNEFFNFNLVEKLKQSLSKNDKSIVKKISSDNDEYYITNLYDILQKNYKLYKKDSKMICYLNETIKKEISLREKNKKESFIVNYYQENMYKRNQITCNELFKLFCHYDTFMTKFDSYGNVIMDDKLKQFLLGNQKSSNDCLLRMVFNKQALDYNFELINIINQFDSIYKFLKDRELGNNSLFYIMDVYKTLQYKLNVDEEDIPLYAISATLSSRKHLIVSEEEAFNRLKQIHKDKKKKCTSTIPRVKGITKNNIRYKVLDKNDPEILICGTQTDSCFKPGAPGESFFRYALTSKYSDVIGIWD